MVSTGGCDRGCGAGGGGLVAGGAEIAGGGSWRGRPGWPGSGAVEAVEWGGIATDDTNSDAESGAVLPDAEGEKAACSSSWSGSCCSSSSSHI